MRWSVRPWVVWNLVVRGVGIDQPLRHVWRRHPHQQTRTWARGLLGRRTILHFTIVLTFLDDGDTEIVLTAAELDGTPGGGFIRFSLTPAQLDTVNNVAPGSRILVVIDPTP